MNNEGQLGFTVKDNEISAASPKSESNIVLIPKICSYNILVQQIACGGSHTHILSQTGFVYSMGSNKEGKLGLGLTYNELNRSTSPRLIESISNIVQISAGESHSVAVDKQQ